MNTPQLLAANCISLPLIEASISARSLRVWIPDAGTETEKLRWLELYTHAVATTAAAAIGRSKVGEKMAF